jgi:tetratricopeptide (TPR) repeat protein
MPTKQAVMQLLQSGRLTEARTLCVQLCQQNANDAEAWFLLAGIHANTGALDEVVRCCRQVITLQSDNTGAYYNLGVALQTLNLSEEAIEAYQHAIRLDPTMAQAHTNLGLVYRQLGQLAEAEKFCREATTLNPAFAQAHNNLGLILKDQNKIGAAIACFKEALRIRPDLAEAHYNIGLCYGKTERIDEAMVAFQEALRRKPDYAAAGNDLGLLQLSRHQGESAIASFRQALRGQPDDADIHNNLGNALMRLHRYDEAAKHFRRATEIRSEFAAAHNNLGNALLDSDDFRDQYDAAEACYRKALRIQPDMAEAYFNLGTCYQSQGKYKEALANFERAVEIKPDYLEAVAGIAIILEHQGEFAKAQELLTPQLDAGIKEINLALAYAAVARHVDQRHQAATLLEGLVEQEPNVHTRSRTYFMLGKLYDETADYDRAFSRYQKANDIDPFRFDPAQNARTFAELRAVFSAERQATRPRASNRSRLPVFIVGMPRSSTSLVEQILASHPLVYGAGELDDLYRITQSLAKEIGSPLPYPGCVEALTRKNIDSIAQRHLDRLGRFSNDVARVTDKMPHNFLSLGLIELLFPEARVIHCMRDPLDTCLSIYFQQFNKYHPYATNLEHLGVYYNHYLTMMAHWKKTLCIPIMDMQYEEMVENPEETSRRLIDFCELEWDDRCLKFHESKRIVTTPSYDQVRRPIYKKSVARWKKYEKHLDPLKNALAGGC